MKRYSESELNDALQTVNSYINRCEKAQGEFRQGTAQHTLLRNRICALYTAKALLRDARGQNSTTKYPTAAHLKKELENAMPPITSIISKLRNAQNKYIKGSANFNRFQKTICHMQIVEECITAELAATK